VFQQILLVLSWLLVPVLLIVVTDDWFLRPRRRLAALPAETADAPWLAFLYSSLMVLMLAAALHLILSERLDFALTLVVISAVGGVIWALDAWVFRPQRDRAARALGKDPQSVPEPGVVDYARSMVPVVVFVLVLRSFLFEPFRIPSDSMMPTLQDGDFILVNKFSYGVKLPVLNTRIIPVGEPNRGDVVVFRYPPDPAVNYIKRVVGLPGDRVKVQSDRIYVNGVPFEEKLLGRYSDGCYANMRLNEVHSGDHVHHTLSCLSSYSLPGPLLPGCNRKIDRGYSCSESDPPVGSSLGDNGDMEEVTVPAGNYLVIGDNRDNSSDSRYWTPGQWSFVPEANLVGSARRVWFNFDLKRRPLVDWGRIGKKID
jgi:signal peptidase I